MRRTRWVVAALTLCVALCPFRSAAAYTTYLQTGFDTCLTPDGSDTHYYGSVVGSPGMATTVDNAPGNLCALQTSPASGAAEYVTLTNLLGSPGGTLVLHGKLRIPSQAAGSCREVAAIIGTAKKGCLLVACDTIYANQHQYVLKAFYRDQSQKVCSGATNTDRECTTVADCTEVHFGEAQCSTSSLATTPAIAYGGYAMFALAQTNGTGSTAGTVTCSLYEGRGDYPSSSVVYNRGTEARIVGKCAGGTSVGQPCNVNGDCPSSTCDVSNVFTITGVSLGSSDTQTGAITAQFDDVRLASSVLANGYLESLPAVGQDQLDAETNWEEIGTGHGCAAGTEYACTADGTLSDGDTTAIEHATVARPTIALQMRDAATPTVAPTPVAVGIDVVGKCQNAGAGATMRLDQADSTGTYTGATALNFGTLATTGPSASYYLLPPFARDTMSSGAAWTLAGINGLKVVPNVTANGSNTIRLSSVVASVFWQTTDPVIPGAIPDRNRDGKVTVDIIGDSTYNNIDFKNAISAALLQPDNLYFRTRGGSKIADSLNEWTTSVLTGGGGDFMGRQVFRGTGGAVPDIIVLSHLTNVMNPSVVDPTLVSSLQGISKGGYCEDDGGANQGHECYCDGKLDNWTSAVGATPGPQITPAIGYCVSHSAFKQSCSSFLVGGVGCACSTNADCTRGGDGFTGICFSNFCAAAGYSCAANEFSNGRATVCEPGCLNAQNCATGVCVRGHSLTAVDAALAQAAALTATAPTPAATPPLGGKPILIMVAPPPTQSTLACWIQTGMEAGAFRAMIRARAKASGAPYIDMSAHFSRDCPTLLTSCASPSACTPTEDATLCYRDGVHFTTYAQASIAAATIAACLTNVRDDGTTATHDGVCTSTKCTAGLIGDPCTTGADCDTWACDFTT